MNCPKCSSVNVVPVAGMMRCQDCEHYFDAPVAPPPLSTGLTNPQLVKCPVCSKEISRNASKCPYCGEPAKLDYAAIGKRNLLVALVIIVFFILLLAAERGSTILGIWFGSQH